METQAKIVPTVLEVEKGQPYVVKEVEIPKILIGVPILAWTHEFAESFLRFWTGLMTYSQKGRRFHVGYRFMYRRPVHMAEEELAQFALDTGCTHLLLMDDDIYDVTPEDLLKLVDADKDVISGIMFASGFPHAMCAFRRYDTNTKVADQPILKGPCRLYEIPPEQRKGVQPVDLIPFCFTLIRTSVFQKVEKPWFTCNTQAPTDSWFMDSVMAKGIQPYAHFDVWLNHRGVTIDNQALMVQMGMIKAQKGEGGVIALTPEEMKRHEMYMRVRLEEAEEKMKEDAKKKLHMFEVSEKSPIATEIIPQDGKTVIPIAPIPEKVVVQPTAGVGV
jgi:hypothetical protein